MVDSSQEPSETIPFNVYLGFCSAWSRFDFPKTCLYEIETHDGNAISIKIKRRVIPFMRVKSQEDV